MIALSESDSLNYGFLNIAHFDRLPSRVTSNRWSLPCNWQNNKLYFVYYFSCIVSISCLIAILCMARIFKTELSSNEINEMSATLEEINENIKHNHVNIVATQRHLEHRCLFQTGSANSSNNNNTTKTMALGCGGIIPMPPPGYPILLDYKSQKRLSSNENCLWILDGLDLSGSKRVANIRLNVECDGFRGDDGGIVVLDWFNWQNLTVFELSRSKDYTPNKESLWHYLSFTSGNRGVGTGFVLRVDAVGIFVPHPVSNMVFTNSSGTVTHGPISDGEKIAIVINPPVKSFVLTLNYLDSKYNEDGSCGPHDSLHIFSVGKKGEQTKLPDMCGSVRNRRFVFKTPIIVGFLASSSTSGKGFKLSWKEN